MIITVDTREQRPFAFERWGVEVQRQKLPVGDYSVPGFEDRAAIERKSLDDLINCFMGDNRNRFERELARGRSYELFSVVVEASLQEVTQGRYTSNLKPNAALQSVMAFWVRYSVPFMFCGSRAGAEYITASLLSKYIYEIERRYQVAKKANYNNDDQDHNDNHEIVKG